MEETGKLFSFVPPKLPNQVHPPYSNLLVGRQPDLTNSLFSNLKFNLTRPLDFTMYAHFKEREKLAFFRLEAVISYKYRHLILDG